MRALQTLENGLGEGSGDRDPISAIWPAAAPPVFGARAVRLVLCRRSVWGAKEAPYYTDYRLVPFRSARLDRKLSKSGFPGAFCGLCAGICRTVSLGSALHTRERDVCLRALFWPVWLVERGIDYGAGLRNGAQAYRQSQRAGHAGDTQRLSRRDLRAELIFRIFSCGKPQGD